MVSGFIILHIKNLHTLYLGCMGGRVVRSLLQLSERWPCHIWHVDRMKGKFAWGWGVLVYPILLCYLPLSGRSPAMTEILLTGTLSLNSMKSINIWDVLSEII